MLAPGWIFVLFVCCFLKNASHAQPDTSNTPPTAKVLFDTTKGPIVVGVWRDWAPRGADHFLSLVEAGFYSDIAFFRCVEGFLTQFGLSDNPDMVRYHSETIMDDENKGHGIFRGAISYAGGGPNTRSTQLFMAFEYLDFLGREPWETAFGMVVEGYDVLDALYKGYGEMVPFNEHGIDQQIIQTEGNAYVRAQFPMTDFIISSRVIERNGVPVAAAGGEL
jgi:peptidyl-prolyl cis-trans isomerase A (cyclophilin A)